MPPFLLPPRADCTAVPIITMQKGLSKYSGGFERGLRSGEGECVYADGAVYHGQWKSDHRHGMFICVPGLGR